MSERKVLSKYYPPDFDPSKITRQRGPKPTSVKLPTVRLMAPFSMKCTTCGEFIYKGRKFNARKEVTDEKYYGITKIRFYIRCTRCASEITFKTDPKHHDYECENGAKRNFEPWREAKLAEETEEERLDRLERELAEHDPMKELEAKAADAKTDMAVADALDQIRSRNARLEMAEKEGKTDVVLPEPVDSERLRQEEEDARIAAEAFRNRSEPSFSEEIIIDEPTMNQATEPTPTFTRQIKAKKEITRPLGIKKKSPLSTVASSSTGIPSTVAVDSKQAAKAPVLSNFLGNYSDSE